MDKLFTVEYKDSNGEDQYMEVEFEADVFMEDDTYDDEFGTVDFQPYPVLYDCPSWDKGLYTFSENWIIAIWLMANLKYVNKQFCNQYIDDNKTDY